MSVPPPPASDYLPLLDALWQAAGNEVALEELQRASGLAATQIHQAIDEFVAQGCLIERSPGGVRLVTAGLACWSDLLESAALRGGWRIGRRVKVFSETTSTNDVAWQAATERDADGLVVLANHQIAGRGRLGRAWRAPAGQAVLLSVLLQDAASDAAEPAASPALDRLTLVCGLAVALGLEAAIAQAGWGRGGSPERIEIKWPNDLLVGGRKLAGILVEVRRLAPSPHGKNAVVAGVGINVTQSPGDFPPELGGRGISLYEASGVMLDRLRVIEAVIGSLNRLLPVNDASDAWLELWRQRCGMLGRHMTFRSGAHTISGRVLDVDPLQGLLVRDDRGGTHFLSARTCSVVP